MDGEGRAERGSSKKKRHARKSIASGPGCQTPPPLLAPIVTRTGRHPCRRAKARRAGCPRARCAGGRVPLPSSPHQKTELPEQLPTCSRKVVAPRNSPTSIRCSPQRPAPRRSDPSKRDGRTIASRKEQSSSNAKANAKSYALCGTRSARSTASLKAFAPVRPVPIAAFLHAHIEPKDPRPKRSAAWGRSYPMAAISSISEGAASLHAQGPKAIRPNVVRQSNPTSWRWHQQARCAGCKVPLPSSPHFGPRSPSSCPACSREIVAPRNSPASTSRNPPKSAPRMSDRQPALRAHASGHASSSWLSQAAQRG